MNLCPFFFLLPEEDLSSSSSFAVASFPLSPPTAIEWNPFFFFAWLSQEQKVSVQEHVPPSFFPYHRFLVLGGDPSADKPRVE